jgi:hypothetical protein
MNVPPWVEHAHSVETPAGTAKGRKSRRRRPGMHWHFLMGAIAAIIAFGTPVHAAQAVENCADNARVSLAALKHTALWQMGILNGRAPELTEAEFVKVCEDLPPSNELSEFLVRKFTAGQEKREIVPVDAIPARVRNAFIAAEDPSFYRRTSADFLSCAKRAALSVDMPIIQRALGGKQNAPVSRFDNSFLCYSAFSWQLAKNLLLNEHRYIIRKFKEMLAAERIEAALDKSQILQLYLNLIYLGRGAWGIAAAAQRHFGKQLSELTVEEAAYLGGLPKEPTLDAVRNYQKALERRNWVIGQMAKGGYISRQEAEAAVLRPLTVSALSAPKPPQ